MKTQRKKRIDYLEEYWENIRKRRKELVQLSLADMTTLKILVQDNFPSIEARLIKSGYPIETQHLYLKIKDNEKAWYYPNNVYKIYETYPLERAIKIISDVSCLILPESSNYQETHPHNTYPNSEENPTINGRCLIVPNGMTIGFGGDATHWTFATVSNFTYFYQFIDGSVWAKNIHDTREVMDFETYYRLTKKQWVKTTEKKFKEQFMSVMNSLTTKFKILREHLDPDTVSFDLAERTFFDGPSNGY